jgi:hypothetical protein
MAYPLIITLELEQEDKERFTALRKAHFPAHSNYLDAHLTLFHRLPSDEPLIDLTLQQLAVRPALLLGVNAVINFSNGVAFTIASEELMQLHNQMQEAFEPWLVRQDRQTLRPHITIQNKVTAFKAKRLQEELQLTFQPYTIEATGFSTWHYIGGPWKRAKYYPFAL